MPERCPSVAVVVPVYNGERTIGACVEALLGLDYPAAALELVVVDNRSTDRTRAVLARYPVHVVEETARQSSYAARNRGIAATRAEVVAFTDADCVPATGWVRALVAALAPAGVGGVAGAIEAYRADTAVERYQARRALRAERAFAHPVLPFAQTANAAYPRAVLELVGGFDADLVFGGDLDLSWRMQRTTGLRLAWAPDALVRHQHRPTWRGLFALYEKNAIANCLLAQRYPHYAEYPRIRTLAYLGRECVRHALRGDVAAVRYAGELSGWLRWHWGAAPAPREVAA
jgi:glycosyltransferase involved in cell wall biosynthesis